MNRNQGIVLFLTALGLLVLPGVFVNNLQANALIQKQTCISNTDCTNIMTCDSNTDSCVLNASVGCQYDPANCQLQSNTIDFLNPCSTFTNLITLNYIGFVNSFFTNCGTAGAAGNQGPIPQFGNVTISGLVATGGAGHLTGLLGQRQWSSSNVLYPTNQGITAPYYVTCLNFNGTLSFPNVDGHGKYTTGCNFVDSGSPKIGYTMTCWMFGISTGGGNGDVTNVICTNWATSTTGGLNLSNVLGFGATLLITGMLIFMSLGLNFGILTATFGNNPQGTKMAQTIGGGLLVFLPLYSEFNTWFSQGFLPYGLDGNVYQAQLGLISIVINVMVFVGLYTISQSGTTNTS